MEKETYKTGRQICASFNPWSTDRQRQTNDITIYSEYGASGNVTL